MTHVTAISVYCLYTYDPLIVDITAGDSLLGLCGKKKSSCTRVRFLADMEFTAT